MRILHTADLHLGQILYQYYNREDEHDLFFAQLRNFVEQHRPDALILSGDVFDVPNPSAKTWKAFTSAFVALRKSAPDMRIVITAGNHDSASRLQAHSDVWELAETTVVGTPPPPDPDTAEEGWEERFIVRIPAGYIIALPFMSGDRSEVAVRLQKYVESENSEQLPVVMTAHLAVSGSDLKGHDFEIGSLRTVDLPRLGDDYDYLALGHIHRPQTLNPAAQVGFDRFDQPMEFPAPVARYSGSPLHVSADETYPHSVSLVDIDRHKGRISILPLRVEQKRHFLTLPEGSDSFSSEKEALNALKKLIKRGTEDTYIRFRFDIGTDLPPDFNNKVYALLEECDNRIRFNPKIVWVGKDVELSDEPDLPKEIEAEVLTQMKNPLDFIEMNISRFDSLDLDELREAFAEIEDELKIMEEEK